LLREGEVEPDSWAGLIYKPNINPITYVLLANAVASLFTLFLLGKWVLPKKWSFNTTLWLGMMAYSLPMLVANLGGTVNETFDRLMLGWWLPNTNGYADEQRGIYGACYKLSILITLFIQAFRMGAEPFFFKQAESDNPQKNVCAGNKILCHNSCCNVFGCDAVSTDMAVFYRSKILGGLKSCTHIVAGKYEPWYLL
jgi:hypothetical protein